MVVATLAVEHTYISDVYIVIRKKCYSLYNAYIRVVCKYLLKKGNKVVVLCITIHYKYPNLSYFDE